jgi:hypothetical protein
MKTYIGIDCGKDGAIAFVNNEGAGYRCNMPTLKLGKGRKIDVKRIATILLNAHKHSNEPDIFVVLEDPGGHAPSAAGLRSMTACFATVETLLIYLEIPHEVVMSQTWQRAFWNRPKMPKGQKFDTKAAALATATRLWPGVDLRASERAKNPHDGIVDALLLAEYGRRKWL